MRADRHPELCGEEQDRDVLVYPADPARVDLDDVDCVDCSSCLKITRFWTCSPVATLIGADRPSDRSRDRECRPDWWAPRSSTGRSAGARVTHVMASLTSQRWFASIAIADLVPDCVAGCTEAADIVLE